jgi:hypothetical protein
MQTLPYFLVLAAPEAPPQDDLLKRMVRNILESPPDMIYRDGIEAIESVETDEDGNLTGVFTDRIGVSSIKRFRFLISDDNIEYELENPDEVAGFSVYQGDILAMFAPAVAKKKNCPNSIPCGNGCTKRGNKCQKAATDLSEETKVKIGKAKAQAAGGSPPEPKPKAEVKFEPEPVKAVEKTHKQLIEDFFKDPKKSITDGLERESAARAEFTKKHKGKKSLELADKAFAARSEATDAIKKNAGKIKELALEEGLPIAGSVIGNVVGGAVAGPVGAVIGDAIGSNSVRKGREVARSYKKAAAELASNEAHQTASRLQKFKNLKNATLSDLKKPETQQAIEKSLVGDVGGWAIGNAVGKSLGAAMPTGFAPLIGAAGSAMALVPNVVQPMAAEAHALVRSGVAPKDAVKQVVSNFVSRGQARDKALRSKMSSRLNELKTKLGSKNSGLTAASA